MKKSVLVLLTLVPLIIGYVATIMAIHPIKSNVYYLLIFFSTVFWFWLGIQYAHSNWKPIMSVLVAHLVFICSILIYWQQWQSSIMFNPSWVSFSKLFTASTPIVFISEKIAVLCELKPLVVMKMERHIGLQILALVYMVIVFSFGLYLGKKLRKKDKASV